MLPLESREVGERMYCYLYKAEKYERVCIVTSTKQRSRKEDVLLPLQSREVGERMYIFDQIFEKDEFPLLYTLVLHTGKRRSRIQLRYIYASYIQKKDIKQITITEKIS